MPCRSVLGGGGPSVSLCAAQCKARPSTVCEHACAGHGQARVVQGRMARSAGPCDQGCMSSAGATDVRPTRTASNASAVCWRGSRLLIPQIAEALHLQLCGLEMGPCALKCSF